MGKTRELTEQEKREEEAMRAFFLNNPDAIQTYGNDSQDDVRYSGTSMSPNAVISAQNTVESFQQPEIDVTNTEEENTVELSDEDLGIVPPVSPAGVPEYTKDNFPETTPEDKAAIKQWNDEVKYTPKNDFDNVAKSTLPENDYRALKDLTAERDSLLSADTPYKKALKDTAQGLYDEKAGTLKTGLNYVTGMVHSLLAFPLADKWGMQDENKAKLDILNDKIHAKSVVPLKKILLDISNKSVELSLQAMDYENSEEGQAMFTNERGNYNVTLSDMDKQVERLEAVINKEDGWQSLLDNVDTDLLTIGTYGLAKNLFHKLPVVKKMERISKGSGEELTPGEKALAESMALESTVMQATSEVEPTGWYKAVDGVLDSASFMGQIALTGGFAPVGKKALTGLGKEVTKKMIQQGVSKGISAGTGVAARVGLDATVNLGMQTLVMPMTYKAMIDKYNGEVEATYNEDGSVNKLLVRDDLYDYYVDMIETNRGQDKLRRAELLSQPLDEAKQKELDEVEMRLGMTTTYTGTNKTIPGMPYDETLERMLPNTALQSMRKGYVGTYNEIFSEKVIGKGFDKIVGKLGVFPRIGTKTAIGRTIKKSVETYNKVGDKTGLNSIPGEYFEEIGVAPMHSLNDGNFDEIEALGNADTHSDILSTIGLMSVFMGTGVTAWNGMQSLRNTDYNRSRRDIRNHFKRLGNSIGEETLAGYVAFNTSNNGFTATEYKNQIQKHRNAGENDKANELEQKMFYNLALKSFQTNTSDEFIKALDKLQSKPKSTFSEETRTNIALARDDIKRLKTTYDRYKGTPNIHSITSLASDKLVADNSIYKINEGIANIRPKLEDDMNTFFPEVDFGGIDNLFEFVTQKFDTEKEQKAHQALLDKIDKENLINLDIYHNLLLAKRETMDIKRDAMREFNKQTSPVYMETIKEEAELLNELQKDKTVVSIILNDENTTEDVEKRVREIASKYLSRNKKGRLSKSNIDDVVNKVVNSVGDIVLLKQAHRDILLKQKEVDEREKRIAPELAELEASRTRILQTNGENGSPITDQESINRVNTHFDERVERVRGTYVPISKFERVARNFSKSVNNKIINRRREARDAYDEAEAEANTKFDKEVEGLTSDTKDVTFESIPIDNTKDSIDIERRRQEELDNKKSKFSKPVYHGGKKKIQGKFKKGKGLETIHFTEDKTLAESYGKEVTEARVDTKNPLVIEGKKTDKEFDEILDKYSVITKEEVGEHDAIIINITLENGENYNEVIIFEAEQFFTVEEINDKYDAELATKKGKTLDFESPKKVSPNINEEQKANLKERISRMYNILAEQLGKKPSFKELVNQYAARTTPEQTEEFFDFISLGWELNGYPKTDFAKVYSEVFDAFRKEAEDFMEDIAKFQPTSRDGLEKEIDDLKDEQEDKEGVITEFTETGVPLVRGQNRTVTSHIKLGFLAMPYEEIIKFGVSRKVTKGTELLQEGVIDFRPLLHPDKFGRGTELRVAIPPAEVLDKIYISYRNNKGEKVSELYNTWLAKKVKDNPQFETTEEYLATVPVIAYSIEDGTPLAYIHDVNWYDKHSVGFEEDPTKQAKLIQEARQEVLALRKEVVNNGLNVVRIASKTGSTFQKLPLDIPSQTISEANPDSILGIVKSNTEMILPGGEIFQKDKDRVLIKQKKPLEEGHTYDLRRAGMQNGKKAYIALPVLRGVQTEGYPLTEQDFNTVKWATAVFFTLNPGIHSYAKKLDGLLEEGQAERITQEVFEQTGWDISTREDYKEFIRQYSLFTKLEYETLADKIFSKDKVYARDFRQHTSKEALARDSRMIKIEGKDGVVTPLNKRYHQFLKDTLHTNIMSFNISKEGETPVYATTIQPIIRIDYAKVGEKTLREKIEKAVEEVKIDQTEVIGEEDISGETDAEKKANELLSKLGFGKKFDFEAIRYIEDTSLLKSIFDTTPGLTIKQEFQLVDYIFNKISKNVSFVKGDSIEKDILLQQIKYAYDAAVQPTRKEVETTLKNISELYNSKPSEYPNLLDIIERSQKLLSSLDSIEQNWKNIENKALSKIHLYTGIKEGKLSDTFDNDKDKVEEDDTVSLRIKNHSKLSLEEDGKQTASYRLRRFFAGIEQRTPKGEIKTGFLGLDTYVGYNEVYDTVAQVLSSPVETQPSFDIMIAKLKLSQETHKWLPYLIEKLENTDQQIKNEFVTNYAKHTLSMMFAMYDKTSLGGYNLKMYHTNAHEITRLITDGWKSNFKSSKLVNSNQEAYSINFKQAENAISEFESWGKFPHIQKRAVIKQWLEDYFGIVMSKDAFDTLIERGLYSKGSYKKYPDMFTGRGTLFGGLKTYLDKIITVNDTEFEENLDNHPFTDMTGVLKSLATLESRYTNQAMTLSFRDNQKTLFGLTPPKFVTDRVLQLKQFNPDTNRNALVENLQNISISSESYFLELLQLEEEFRDKFKIDHIGITSLQQLGRKASAFSSLTSLNKMDHDVVKRTGFQDMRQGTVKATLGEDGKLVDKNGEGVSMRVARMFLPTMSDKSQMLFINTGVFNFLKDKRKAFLVNEDETLDFTESVTNLLYNQLIKPELKRILKFHTDIHKTDIQDYDLSAQIFNLVPVLNNIKDKDGIRLIELIATNPELYNMEWVEANYKVQLNKELKKVIDKKVEKKIAFWDSNIIRDKNGKIEKLEFFDNSYLSEASGDLHSKLIPAAYDFVLNSFLTNANMFSVLSGDTALYGQDKNFSNFEVDNVSIAAIANNFGKADIFKPYSSYNDFIKNIEKLYTDELISEQLFDTLISQIRPLPYRGSDSSYLNIAKKSGINLGKRLALLIAPGTKVANAIDENYVQVFLKDSISIAENSEYLIDLYYGTKALEGVKEKLKDYHNTKNEAVKKSIRESLKNEFPTLADYFDIPSTDSQEYTTVREHINILNRLGRISPAMFQEVSDKLDKGLDLTKVEMKFVLQPMKPVYTGQIIDENQDVARTVYIKSSSYPLLPQLTKTRKLEALRLKLEKLEKESGMSVRASYQSANKVGAISNPIDAFTESTDEQMQGASMVLNRNDFRIQQDVPFKSDDNKYDKASMGTQIFKILFGDGMINLDGFVYNGKTYTGKQLHDIFTENVGGLIDLKRKSLFRELGLNEEGIPIDENESITKLQKLLQTEAEKRGFPRQDIAGLKFVLKEETDDNGNIINSYYDFKLPLWISSNSNKYESLLNAIVTNRIITQKMPGNQFVLGAEEGYDLSEDMSEVDKSAVIHVAGFKGGELKGVQDKDGNFTYAEVYVPSKFKDRQGNLIDFYQNGVSREFKYLIRNSQGQLELDMDMVDNELLNNFSFRTPTSSHVSASIIKIAGILPPINGDLMVVPKNFIPQKGIDYDVDKETAYQLHHVLNQKTGKIEILSQEHITRATSGLHAKLKKLQESGSIPGNLGIAMAKFDEMASFNIAKAIREIQELDELTALSMGEEELGEIIFSEDASIESKIEAIEDKLNIKLLENEFIKVHLSVYSNPSKEVQRKINKVLSMASARKQADIIEAITNKNDDIESFTVLSDEYQREKMDLGADGKMGIAVYSNFVTLHGATTQVVGDKIFLGQKNSEGVIVNKQFKIGNFISNGELGRLMSLDGDRYISEVLAERQNTATDNEKEQIMGRVHINGMTISVDALLVSLGFDKGGIVDGNETSIAYLLLSQPIIKDYVEQMSESQGITAEYVFGAEDKIIGKLVEKYSENYKTDPGARILSQTEFERLGGQLTSENMIKEMESSAYKPGLQLAALQTFLELKDYSRQLDKIQSVINTTDLGKSVIEAKESYDSLQTLDRNPLIIGAERLIGEYTSIHDVAQKPEGSFQVGDVYIKPTTPQGHIVVNGVKIGTELWNDYFPYNNESFNAVIDEIFSITEGESKSDSKRLELQFNIFKGIKRYINSNPTNGFFTESPMLERKSLFIDTEDNQSLGSYMQNLRNTSLLNFEDDFKVGVNSFKTNRLLSKITYDVNTNGLPSLIKYNNTSSENFDEDYLYTSLAELTIEKYQLPDKNGESYDTQKLVGDMVAYAYLEGGVQEAIQFIKYIPVEYLESMGFTTILQEYSNKKRNNIFSEVLGIKQLNLLRDSTTDTHTFVKQFIQHNPQMARQYSLQDEKLLFSYEKNSFDENNKLNSFYLESNEGYPKFISKKYPTRSKKKQDKFSLFQHVGLGQYKRIPVLGIHGMNEYDMGNEHAQSVLESGPLAPVYPKHIPYKGTDKKEAVDTFGLKTNASVKQILDNIKNFANISIDSEYKHFRITADILQKVITETTTIEVGDTTEGGTRAIADGRLYYETEEAKQNILIEDKLFEANNNKEIARVVMHEMAHAATIKELLKYFDKNGKPIRDLPPHVTRLYTIYSEVKRQLAPELKVLKDKIKRRENFRNDYVLTAEELVPGKLVYDKQDTSFIFKGVNENGELRLQKKDGKIALAKSDTVLYRTSIDGMIKDITFSETEAKITYAGTDIFEFITTAFTESAFQRRFSEVPYKNSGKSIWTKIREAVRNILLPLGVLPKVNSVTYEALESIIDFIEIEHNTGLDKGFVFGQPIAPDGKTTPKDLQKLEELERSIFKKDRDAGNTTSITKFSLPIKYNGINSIFEQSPKLSNIGTQEQYSAYLETIFPNSKVKDIVYHGTTEFEGETFKKDKLASLTGTEDAKVGFHFSDKKTATNFGIPSKLRTKKDIFTIPVVLNMSNPEYMDNMGELRGTINNKINPSNKVRQLIKNGKNSIQIKSYQGGIDNIVFEPEQIHILGSKKDIEGFKTFVDKNDNLPDICD